jgi:hypothetical protein
VYAPISFSKLIPAILRDSDSATFVLLALSSIVHYNLLGSSTKYHPFTWRAAVLLLDLPKLLVNV